METRGLARLSCPEGSGASALRVAFWLGVLSTGVVTAWGKSPMPDSLARGGALFQRVWEPEDRRGHGGDGLGPVFNERSCVACHNLGGPGGAGPASKNVDIISVLFSPSPPQPTARAASVGGTDSKPERPRPDLDEMTAIHPGFATNRSLVVHRFGTSPNYESWRRALMAGDSPQPGTRRRTMRHAGDASESQPPPLDRPAPLPERASRGSFRLQRSQRNSTALFGAGLIDTIPDAAIEAAVDAPHRQSFKRGRVSRLKGGRIGRFGWKGQMATLEEFVLTACSVELGLEVPGHSQAMSPVDFGRKREGLDMTKGECDDLIAYVASLSAPLERAPSNALGREVFEQIGCADCHMPALGGVKGIYSDLLLHDMGDGLEDTGGYGTMSSGEEIPEPRSPPAVALEAGRGKPTPPTGPAGRREWRTPPLWGVRDSAPYMHDGRAPTLERAIELHQGDARGAALRYQQLPPTKKRQLLQFLKSLGAPRPVVHRGSP